jgi:hypothetical protein
MTNNVHELDSGKNRENGDNAAYKAKFNALLAGFMAKKITVEELREMVVDGKYMIVRPGATKKEVEDGSILWRAASAVLDTTLEQRKAA